jgi:hypothetical protein
MRLGSGYALKRKDPEGQVVQWKLDDCKLRIQMLSCSYIDREWLASSMFKAFRERSRLQ